MANRVDFDELKALVSITDVADWLGIQVKANGRGECPFCEHPKSFTITPAKGMWGCFRCQKRGSIIDLVFHHKKMDSVREAALAIQEHFLGQGTVQSPAPRNSTVPAGGNSTVPKKRNSTVPKAVDFEQLASQLAKIKARLQTDGDIMGSIGFPKEVFQAIGVGYDPRGKAIRIPLFFLEKGHLHVGYASLPTEGEQCIEFHSNLADIINALGEAPAEAEETPNQAAPVRQFLRVVK